MGNAAENITPKIITKFRKKPISLEAVQFNKFGDHPAVVQTDKSPTGFGITTLESTAVEHEVTLGDWIIKGVKGEFYACKPDIFSEIYEREDGSPV